MSTTFSTTAGSARPALHPLARLSRYADSIRTTTRRRRELDAVLAGHHGGTMRNELLAMLGNG